METDFLGLVLDSSVIIEAERAGKPVEELLEGFRNAFGEIEISISAVTVLELVHGVARARTPEIRDRRRAFIDELKRHVPVHPVTDEAAELGGVISGEQAENGIVIPPDDWLIGVAALEQDYGVLTRNARHFRLIPGLVVVEPPA